MSAAISRAAATGSAAGAVAAPAGAAARQRGPFRVGIIGSGFAGAALAQRLQRTFPAWRVSVFERRPSSEAVSTGYRIRLQTGGLTALRSCLPAELFALVERTSVSSMGFPAFLDRNTLQAVQPQRMQGGPGGPAGPAGLRPQSLPVAPLAPAAGPGPGTVHPSVSSATLPAAIISASGDRPPRPPAGGEGLAVSRSSLLSILLLGLHEPVHMGHSLQRYEILDDGTQSSEQPSRYRLHFLVDAGDGSRARDKTEDVDLLIGADGINSPVREQWKPEIEIVDTNGRTIYSKVWLDGSNISDSMPNLVPATGGMRAVMRTGEEPALLAEAMRFPVARVGELQLGEKADQSTHTTRILKQLSAQRPFIYVVFVAQREWYKRSEEEEGCNSSVDIANLRGADLLRILQRTVAHWNQEVATLLSRCDPACTAAVRVRTVIPFTLTRTSDSSQLPPVLLGDALHPMTPIGLGANLALEDAALLVTKLQQHCVAAASSGDGSESDARPPAKDLQAAVDAFYTEAVPIGMETVRASQKGGANMFAQPALPEQPQQIKY